jgi:hypothetical protein
MPSISIPDTTPGQKKQVVCDVALLWQRRYPKHFSDGNRTKIPNINRDRFMDILAEVYDEKQDLLELLEKTNARLKHQFSGSGLAKLSLQTLSKCADSDCWLFIMKPDNLADEIRKSI